MTFSTRRDHHIERELGISEANLRHPLARPILWACLLCIVAFILWAWWAEVAEITHGEGKVVPMTRLQKIQSLDGGILEEVLVHEGDTVHAGQLLGRLSDTRSKSSYQETENQVEALYAAIARLQAEVLEKESISFPDEVDTESPLAQSERQLFQARREKLHEAEASIKREISIARQRLARIQPLVDRQAVSEMEALSLRQDIAGMQGRLAEISNTWVQDAYSELTDRNGKLNALEQVLNKRRDQFQSTALLSPVDGRVNAIDINTQGGVVQPGETIMSVIPIDDQLMIEAHIPPQDVAFLAPGMPASVKITAYDYTVYGDLEGEVRQISADTIEKETPRGQESYYKVYVRTDAATLQHRDQELPIIPGMIAQVDIHTGERSILNYLLRPLLKARLE